jgi:hypothetical protein
MNQQKIVQHQNQQIYLKRNASESLEELTKKMPKLIPIPKLVTQPLQQQQQQQRINRQDDHHQQQQHRNNRHHEHHQQHQQQHINNHQQQHHQHPHEHNVCQQLIEPKTRPLQQQPNNNREQMKCDQKIEAIKQEHNHSEAAIKLVISKGKVISKEKIVIDIEPEVESPAWPEFLKSKVDFLVESHEESASQVLDPTLVNKLLAIKEGDSSVSIRTEDVLSFVSQHSKQFHQFATMQK